MSEIIGEPLYKLFKERKREINQIEKDIQLKDKQIYLKDVNILYVTVL